MDEILHSIMHLHPLRIKVFQGSESISRFPASTLNPKPLTLNHPPYCKKPRAPSVLRPLGPLPTCVAQRFWDFGGLRICCSVTGHTVLCSDTSGGREREREMAQCWPARSGTLGICLICQALGSPKPVILVLGAPGRYT